MVRRVHSMLLWCGLGLTNTAIELYYNYICMEVYNPIPLCMLDQSSNTICIENLHDIHLVKEGK